MSAEDSKVSDETSEDAVEADTEESAEEAASVEVSESTESDSEEEETPSEQSDEEVAAATEAEEESDASGDGEKSAEPADGEEAAEEAAPQLSPEQERRQSGRKGVKLSRLISSKIIDGESARECYLHLVDISEGGFRINSDDPFPEDREFVLEIVLTPFGNELATKAPRKAFPVKTVWAKSLVGGMVVSGLAFQNLDDEGREIVEAIMQGASPQGRRMHFRLNRVLGVELGRSEEEQQWLYPLTLDLSVEGMRICLSEPLTVGAKFPIKVFLEFELPTVSAEAEVMWQETMPSGRVQVGLKFEEMSERDAMAIKTYIDQCLRQDEAHRRL